MITSFSTEELDSAVTDVAISKKSARKILSLIFAFLAIIAFIVVLTYALQLWGGKKPPNVLGFSAVNAEYVLEESGFEVEENYVISDDIEGIVLSMDPSSDVRVGAGTTVKINISKLRVVPSIVGLDVNEAKQILKENGYSNIKCSYVESDVAENLVIDTFPQEGQQCESGNEVELFVSSASKASEDAANTELASFDYSRSNYLYRGSVEKR